jgi:hypothetical protein
MKKLLLCLQLILIGLYPVNGLRRSFAGQLNDISLVQLIATPEKYDGKVVQVAGFLSLEFEGHILYLHQADYENGMTKNGVWIVRNSLIDQNAEKLDKQYVILVGTFHAPENDHVSIASGSIKDITSVTLLSKVRTSTPR